MFPPVFSWRNDPSLEHELLESDCEWKTLWKAKEKGITLSRSES